MLGTTNSVLKQVNNNLTKQEIIDLIYPIGSIYLSMSSVNPQTYLGGGWLQIALGRTLVGVSTDPTSDFYLVNKTGGEKEHTLTTNEMPTHNHKAGDSSTNSPYYVRYETDKTYYGHYGDTNGGTNQYMFTTNSVFPEGGDQPHNNMPPYLTCYIWQRVS